MEIFGTCSNEMVAWVRYSQGSSSRDTVQKLDLDLCDEQGKVCIKIKEWIYMKFDTLAQYTEIIELNCFPMDLKSISDIHKPYNIKLKNLSIIDNVKIEMTSENRISEVDEYIKHPLNQKNIFSTLKKQSIDTTPIFTDKKKIIEEKLIISLAKVLFVKKSDIDPEKPFVEMGLDLNARTEWVQAINQEYGTLIPDTIVNEYPNIQKFSRFLNNKLNQKESVLTQSTFDSTSSITLDEILKQVQQGVISIESAEYQVGFIEDWEG